MLWQPIQTTIVTYLKICLNICGSIKRSIWAVHLSELRGRGYQLMALEGFPDCIIRSYFLPPLLDCAYEEK